MSTSYNYQLDRYKLQLSCNYNFFCLAIDCEKDSIFYYCDYVTIIHFNTIISWLVENNRILYQ